MLCLGTLWILGKAALGSRVLIMWTQFKLNINRRRKSMKALSDRSISQVKIPQRKINLHWAMRWTKKTSSRWDWDSPPSSAISSSRSSRKTTTGRPKTHKSSQRGWILARAECISGVGIGRGNSSSDNSMVKQIISESSWLTKLRSMKNLKARNED